MCILVLFISAPAPKTAFSRKCENVKAEKRCDIKFISRTFIFRLWLLSLTYESYQGSVSFNFYQCHYIFWFQTFLSYINSLKES